MIVDTRAAKERYGIAPYRSFTPLTSKFTLNKDKKKKKGPLKLIYIYSTRGCRNFFSKKSKKTGRKWRRYSRSRDKCNEKSPKTLACLKAKTEKEKVQKIKELRKKNYTKVLRQAYSTGSKQLRFIGYK